MTPPTRSIVVDYDLPHPPDKVWRALTDPRLVARWLMETDLQPTVGHAFTFRAQPMPGWDGLVQCKVLAVEPMQRIQYSWVGGAGPMRLDSVVTWTLTATATGTRLRLEHAGFAEENVGAYEGLARGWRGKVGERLAEVIGAQ